MNKDQFTAYVESLPGKFVLAVAERITNGECGLYERFEVHKTLTYAIVCNDLPHWVDKYILDSEHPIEFPYTGVHEDWWLVLYNAFNREAQVVIADKAIEHMGDVLKEFMEAVRNNLAPHFEGEFYEDPNDFYNILEKSMDSKAFQVYMPNIAAKKEFTI